jgi:hypothetical protein
MNHSCWTASYNTIQSHRKWCSAYHLLNYCIIVSGSQLLETMCAGQPYFFSIKWATLSFCLLYSKLENHSHSWFNTNIYMIGDTYTYGTYKRFSSLLSNNKKELLRDEWAWHQRWTTPSIINPSQAAFVECHRFVRKESFLPVRCVSISVFKPYVCHAQILV